MFYKNTIYFLFILLITGCTQPTNEEKLSLSKNLGDADTVCGYSLNLPKGWQEVIKEEDIKKMVFWAFSNSNYTKFTEVPVFRAWISADQDCYLTVMELKRHRNMGTSTFAAEILRMLPEMGWTIEETGSKKIQGNYCKWWIQSHLQGAIQQQCYFIGKGPFYYAFVFTTSYLSKERQQQFEEIMNTIGFQKDL
ncbi:MAG: hypothetical protein JSS12_10385 [Verrucomicrobia bacterium]|nr:hypothetical protein [Verrucomicrobiota bacterium]